MLKQTYNTVVYSLKTSRAAPTTKLWLSREVSLLQAVATHWVHEGRQVRAGQSPSCGSQMMCLRENYHKDITRQADRYICCPPQTSSISSLQKFLSREQTIRRSAWSPGCCKQVINVRTNWASRKENCKRLCLSVFPFDLPVRYLITGVEGGVRAHLSDLDCWGRFFSPEAWINKNKTVNSYIKVIWNSINYWIKLASNCEICGQCCDLITSCSLCRSICRSLELLLLFVLLSPPFSLFFVLFHLFYFILHLFLSHGCQ